MSFYFDDKKGDPLMAKINMRDISARSKRWDHPVKNLFKYSRAMTQQSGNILDIPKKERERYCVALFSLALAKDSQRDWWTHMPNFDPPDGFVMTIVEEIKGAYKGYLREIQVVEHRAEPESVIEGIRDKMLENSYEPNTVLACLGLTPGIHNFEFLANQLASVQSQLKHIFIVFPGAMWSPEVPNVKPLSTTYTAVQLLPVFQSVTFDLTPYLNDYKERYDKGEEVVFIDGSKMFFKTENPKYT